MTTIDLDQERRTRTRRGQRTADQLTRAVRAGRAGDEVARQDALDRVVELNMGVAESVARRYARRGIALEDLTQVAYLALVRSVGSYEPDRGEDLLSYVVPSITGEIRRHFRDQGWTIRPPRDVQRAHSRILRTGTSRERYDTPAIEDLARRVDESVELVREALLARGGYDALSLDKPTDTTDGASETAGPGGAGGIDVGDPDQAHAQAAAEARMMLAPLVATMDAREQQILRWRFAEELSQRQIAERLEMTQVQVSRLLQRMLTQLRAALGDVG